MTPETLVHFDGPDGALRRRLLRRVRRSQRLEGQFQTVRRDDGWSDAPDGTRRKTLAQTAIARTVLVELAPAAALPPDPRASQLELVVLGGDAHVGTLPIACGEAVCAPHDGTHTVRAGAAGARLFVRYSAPPDPAARLDRVDTGADAPGWVDFVPGVRILPLREASARRSLLVRMVAGASVNAHAHALEEECLMLGGEAFVGDTLLREGDYQLAPAGSEHGAVTTDVGALFYVHGALDPAAY